MQKQHNIGGIMRDRATEGAWRLDLNAESQIEQPAAPYLGPAESPAFEHDGFMLPPPATEDFTLLVCEDIESEDEYPHVVDVDTNAALATLSPCAWSCVSMKMVLAFMFGAMYLYFDQYGGSE